MRPRPLSHYLLRDLAHLFEVEACAATGDPYASSAHPPTAEQLEESDRLWAISDELMVRADAAWVAHSTRTEGAA